MHTTRHVEAFDCNLKVSLIQEVQSPQAVSLCKLDSQEFDTSRRGGRRPHHWGPPQYRASLALPPPRRRPPPEPGRKVGPERKLAREHVSKARTWTRTHWGSRVTGGVSKRPRRPLIWTAHSHGPLASDWPGWLRGLCTGQSGLRGLRHWISESAAQSAQRTVAASLELRQPPRRAAE